MSEKTIQGYIFELDKKMEYLDKMMGREVFKLKREQYAKIRKEIDDIALNITNSESDMTKMKKEISATKEWVKANSSTERFEILDATRDAMIERILGKIDGQLSRFMGLRERMNIVNKELAKIGASIEN